VKGGNPFLKKKSCGQHKFFVKLKIWGEEKGFYKAATHANVLPQKKEKKGGEQSPH